MNKPLRIQAVAALVLNFVPVSSSLARACRAKRTRSALAPSKNADKWYETPESGGTASGAAVKAGV